MKRTFTLDEFGSINHAPAGGYGITDTGANFATMGVGAATVIENRTLGTTGTVSSATEDALVTSIYFNPGDLYLITLPAEWTVLGDESAPVTDEECRVCGFSFHRSQLKSGRCEDCVDKPFVDSSIVE